MNIIYGINGEGMGHAMRSSEIIKELSKENKVKVIAGGRAYHYLKQNNNNIKEIPYLSFVNKNGKIKQFQTFLLSLLKAPFLAYNFFSLLGSCIIKRPSIIITDFEPITSYVSLFLRIPLISIDNQHVVTDTKVHESGTKLSLFLYKAVVHLMCPFPKKKIITSFFYPEILTKNTFFVPPIIRSSISKEKRKEGNKILVYLTSENEPLLDNLEDLKISCVVYGKTDRKSSKCITIKKFDDKKFAHDLASSKGVICSGGMTTLGESIFLKKPIISVPLMGQVEQEINSYYIEKNGYGISTKTINKETLKKFIKNMQRYKNNLKKINFSNTATLKKIKEEISKSA